MFESGKQVLLVVAEDFGFMFILLFCLRFCKLLLPLL